MFKSMQKDHKLITRKELQIAVCHKQTLGFYTCGANKKNIFTIELLIEIMWIINLITTSLSKCGYLTV